MKLQSGTAQSIKVSIRLTREDWRKVEEATADRGYANTTAFIRGAIRNEVMDAPK